MSFKLWFKHAETFVCAPPKCGGTALYCAALGIDPALGRDVFSSAQRITEFYAPDETDGHAVMAVRDPVGRFMSLWRDKCRDGDVNFPQLAGLTPDELLDFVEGRLMEDAHWAPQIVHWVPGCTRVHYMALHGYIGLPEQRVNETHRRLTDPHVPADRIRRVYSSDGAIWKGL